MEKRVAIYLRVSTDNQTHESQEAELKEYCERRKWTQLQWFRDTASGVKQNRTALNQMMDLVRRGRIDVILAFKLDRIARSLSHLAQIIAEIQTQNVALVCPSQGIDTSNSNPAAHLQLNILAAVAQFERELITERVKAGVKAARERGVKLGRPPTPKCNQTRIVDLAKAGATASEIARSLQMAPSTVRQIVSERRTDIEA